MSLSGLLERQVQAHLCEVAARPTGAGWQCLPNGPGAVMRRQAPPPFFALVAVIIS
jgi:hypothetical protein